MLVCKNNLNALWFLLTWCMCLPDSIDVIDVIDVEYSCTHCDQLNKLQSDPRVLLSSDSM